MKDYDDMGRLTKETDGTNEISYTYDASGNRLTFDKTSLSQRSYGYLPGNISWYSTSNNAFAEYTHDNNGNILSKTGNRVTDYTMTYDGFNRLISSITGNRLFGFEKDGRFISENQLWSMYNMIYWSITFSKGL